MNKLLFFHPFIHLLLLCAKAMQEQSYPFSQVIKNLFEQ